jgi:hypothetical protein
MMARVTEAADISQKRLAKEVARAQGQAAQSIPVNYDPSPPERNTNPEDLRKWQEAQQRGLQTAFRQQLLFNPEQPNPYNRNALQQSYFDSAQKPLTENAGPFLVAWVKGGPIPSFDLDTPIDARRGGTLLVADIEVKGLALGQTSVQRLPVRLGEDDWQFYVETASPDMGGSALVSSAQTNADILLPARVLARHPGEVIVTLSAISQTGWQPTYRPKGADDSWPANHAVNPEPSMMGMGRSNWTVFTQSYRINSPEEWKDGEGVIEGAIFLEYFDERYGGRTLVTLTAKTLTEKTLLESEGWKPWTP